MPYLFLFSSRLLELHVCNWMHLFTVQRIGRGMHINFLMDLYNYYALQIEKKEVDNLKEGKRIPSCQLVARCITKRPTTLEHLVTLNGAKDPHNTFTIYRSYDSGTYIILLKNKLSMHRLSQRKGLYFAHQELEARGYVHPIPSDTTNLYHRLCACDTYHLAIIVSAIKGSSIIYVCSNSLNRHTTADVHGLTSNHQAQFMIEPNS
jgi:hypothetical protein